MSVPFVAWESTHSIKPDTFVAKEITAFTLYSVFTDKQRAIKASKHRVKAKEVLIK
jgi:hypothetical protein